MTPTTQFACTECGHHFEVSAVVAQSRVNMTLCPECAGHEIVETGQGWRESAGERATGEDAA
jgi:putative FmdB family regulatory protein